MAYTSWQSWDNIIDYIKNEMGADVMALELSDQEIIKKIQDHVLPEFSAYDGLHRYYKMDENMILSKDPIYQYQIKDYPYKIFRVKNVIYQANYINYSQAFANVNSGDVTDFLVRQNYLDISAMARADNTWRFIAPDIFQVTKAAYSYLTDNFVLELDVCHNDPVTISPGMYDSFRDLAASYIMNVIGKIRKKYNNFNTPFGNIQLNADELIADAKELRQKTLDNMMRTPPEQYIFDMN